MFNGEFREMGVRYMLCGGSSGGRDDRSLDRSLDRKLDRHNSRQLDIALIGRTVGSWIGRSIRP